MFIPWLGLFEQIRLADVFMHYDDVQLPQGRSFMTRVQIKTANGILWLSAPIDRKKSGRLINQVVFSAQEDWRNHHLKTLHHAYAKTPHFDEMMELAEHIYGEATNNLAEFNILAVERIAKWLGLTARFFRSSNTNINGASSQRLIDLCLHLDAGRYVTGLGALKYLEHEKFDDKQIKVEYMQYQMRPYPQMHGEFTPYVSILDAIANCGDLVRELVCSTTIGWKEMSHGTN